MSARLRAVLVGAGKVGAGMAADPKMARYYPYATHAQVLATHPGFEWVGVVDTDPARLDEVRARWGVEVAGLDVADVAGRARPEVLVVATPPTARGPVFAAAPSSLRAVLLEKPLATTRQEAIALSELARSRGWLVSVNYWRRADATFRALASGGLTERVGRVQGATLYYGNGLRNNGSHLVDFARMLFGEVEEVRALDRGAPAGPITGDVQFPFHLRLHDGTPVYGQPLDFRHYRENGVDVWGERGRMSILLEGLSVTYCPRRENRSTEGEGEVASDAPELLHSTVGHAFYEMYSDLAHATSTGQPPCSTLASALTTDAVVDALFASAAADGAKMRVG